ncbi:MAG TPA: hypothetical protein VGJ04_08670, partial [Pirellulales bacterium]
AIDLKGRKIVLTSPSAELPGSVGLRRVAFLRSWFDLNLVGAKPLDEAWMRPNDVVSYGAAVSLIDGLFYFSWDT